VRLLFNCCWEHLYNCYPGAATAPGAANWDLAVNGDTERLCGTMCSSEKPTPKNEKALLSKLNHILMTFKALKLY